MVLPAGTWLREYLQWVFIEILKLLLHTLCVAIFNGHLKKLRNLSGNMGALSKNVLFLK